MSLHHYPGPPSDQKPGIGFLTNQQATQQFKRIANVAEGFIHVIIGCVMKFVISASSTYGVRVEPLSPRKSSKCHSCQHIYLFYTFDRIKIENLTVTIND